MQNSSRCEYVPLIKMIQLTTKRVQNFVENHQVRGRHEICEQITDALHAETDKESTELEQQSRWLSWLGELSQTMNTKKGQKRSQEPKLQTAASAPVNGRQVLGESSATSIVGNKRPWEPEDCGIGRAGLGSVKKADIEAWSEAVSAPSSVLKVIDLCNED